MANSFFLTYVSSLQIFDVKEVLSDKWDLELIEHDSSFFGVYFRYRGLYADNLTIKNNRLDENSWLMEDYVKYKTIIEVSFTEGRKKDKISKSKYMKIIMNSFDSTLIKEEEL